MLSIRKARVVCSLLTFRTGVISPRKTRLATFHSTNSSVKMLGNAKEMIGNFAGSAKEKIGNIAETTKEKVDDLTKNIRAAVSPGGTSTDTDVKPGQSTVPGMGSQSGMQRWVDKVAVVTGASSGIGEALARRLAKHGMIVVGAARRMEKLQELKQQCPDGRFYPFQADITNEMDIINLFKFVEEKFGRVDVLINNAGVTRLVSVIDPSSEGMKTLFDLNVLAPCFCTREALRIMEDKGIKSGYIIFTNSIHGHMVTHQSVTQKKTDTEPALFYPYEATKHALKVLKEGLRMELRQKGSKIRVGEVSPGAVSTEISSSFKNKDESEATAKKHEKPLKNEGDNADSIDPEEIVDAYIFMLQSPERNDVTEIVVNHIVK